MPLRKIKEPTREENCLDREHNPPDMYHYEPGTYEYICPSCGKRVVFEVPLVT